MDYAAWMREQHKLGASPRHIAHCALLKPISLPEGMQGIAPLLRQIATSLGIDIANIHVVGSARFGLSLRDGAIFTPRFSDLDLAIVDRHLHARCTPPSDRPFSSPRFPESELPSPERESVRQLINELSISVKDKFSFISIAAYADTNTLIEVQARRIQAFLSPAPKATIATTDSVTKSFDGHHFSAAALNGMPRFLDAIEASSPRNSSPYVTNEIDFREAFGTSPARQQLLAALEQALTDMAGVVEISCSLIGGSFIDRNNPIPRDLDVVFFYRAHPTPSFEPGHALMRLSRKLFLSGIDARFVPCDSEPWLTVKMASYFTSLYYADRQEFGHQRGLVLLIPS